jgi:hypothetical protein
MCVQQVRERECVCVCGRRVKYFQNNKKANLVHARRTEGRRVGPELRRTRRRNRSNERTHTFTDSRLCEPCTVALFERGSLPEEVTGCSSVLARIRRLTGERAVLYTLVLVAPTHTHTHTHTHTYK